MYIVVLELRSRSFRVLGRIYLHVRTETLRCTSAPVHSFSSLVVRGLSFLVSRVAFSCVGSLLIYIQISLAELFDFVYQ